VSRWRTHSAAQRFLDVGGVEAHFGDHFRDCDFPARLC
jgi:hypothetical protein